MATVRLSQQLSRDLLKTAEEKYKTSNPEPHQSPELLSELREALNNVPVFKDIETLMGSIHVTNAEGTIGGILSGLEKKDVTDLRITGITKHKAAISEEFGEVTNTAGINVELPTPVKLPAGGGYLNYRIDISMFSPTVRDSLHTKIAAAIDAQDEWNTKFVEFSKSIDSVISQCNTVKQLLEVWPTAEKLLPADVIQKLHTKVTRKIDADKVRDLSQFDADAANQVLLTSSLLGD